MVTRRWQLKLPADHFCILEIPGVIAHCTPGVVETHLHPSLQLCIPSHQPHTTTVASFKETHRSLSSFPSLSGNIEGLTGSCSTVHFISSTNTVLYAITHKRLVDTPLTIHINLFRYTNSPQGADNISTSANSICVQQKNPSVIERSMLIAIFMYAQLNATCACVLCNFASS